MGKWEETYLKEDSLYTALVDARSAGELNGGQDRVQFIGPLLNAIVDQSYKWAPDQCARFFEKLLRKYVRSKDLELLLAVSGFGMGDENIETLAERLEWLRKKHLDKYDNDDSTLRKRASNQLERIANLLELDHKNNESRLAKQLLASVLSDRDLEKLRIDGVDLPRESDSNSDADLKRTERISNIGPTDGQFVGRTGILQALEDGFREGCRTQIISGDKDRGSPALRSNMFIFMSLNTKLSAGSTHGTNVASSTA